MSTRDEALALHNERITAESLAGATVETETRPPAKITVSARIEPDLSIPLLAEAERVGKKPSQVVGDLVREGLARRASERRMVTINVDDLHRAIDDVVRQMAGTRGGPATRGAGLSEAA